MYQISEGDSGDCANEFEALVMVVVVAVVVVVAGDEPAIIRTSQGSSHLLCTTYPLHVSPPTPTAVAAAADADHRS